MIQVLAFHCGGDRVDLAVHDPFDDDVGTKVSVPYFFYLIEHPRGRVLFDSGVHPALSGDPRSRLGAMADAFVLELGPDDHVEGQLKAADLSPADIDCVVQSHLHFDHAGGLEQVPGVPVYLQAAELEFARKPPVYQHVMYVQQDFSHDIDWRLLEGDHDLFGDGSVRILSTPGHTAGHQSLMVTSNGRSIILLADAAYALDKMRERRLPAVLWSPDAMVASWERLEELERELTAQVVCTHELNWRELIPLAPQPLWSGDGGGG
jgi:glyoxylase-like metal-dependent hydrolase (beta-lactamase superfamily II)